MDQEIRQRRVQLHARGRADRPLRAVRRDHAEVGVHHVGDLARGEQPAEIERLRLEDVDDVVLQQVGELLLVREALAGRDGDRAAPRHFDHRVDVRVRYRLLEPHRPRIVHRLREFDRSGNVEPAMSLDQQVHGVPNRFAHRADDVEGEVELARGQRAPVVAEGIELERRVAALDDRLRLLGEALRCTRPAIPAIGVSAELLVTASAPQVVNGLAARLSNDVPAGNFDGRDRAHVDLRALGINVADEPLRQDFDLKRVHAKHKWLQFVDGRLDGLPEVVQRSLADAVDAFVGADLREEPVLPRIAGDVGVDGGDFHGFGCPVVRLSGYQALRTFNHDCSTGSPANRPTG